jgi:hypothetical protein
MTTRFHGFSSMKAMCSIVTLSAALSMTTGLAFAGGDATEDQILKALQPKPLTRSLSLTPPADPFAECLSGNILNHRNHL